MTASLLYKFFSLYLNPSDCCYELRKLIVSRTEIFSISQALVPILADISHMHKEIPRKGGIYTLLLNSHDSIGPRQSIMPEFLLDPRFLTVSR